tara:strand:+ start:83 stop:325 length:243 start_codon:yes stop_codon:yes gene_type:complete
MDLTEIVSDALIRCKPANWYELLDLLGEYNITFEAEEAGYILSPNSSPEYIKRAVEYMNWDSFQDENEISELLDYINEIV